MPALKRFLILPIFGQNKNQYYTCTTDLKCSQDLLLRGKGNASHSWSYVVSLSCFFEIFDFYA